MITKVCTKCKKEKSLNQFGKHKRGLYGYNSVCKLCACEATKKWQRNNPVKRKQLRKSWKINNPEKIRISKRKWEKKHTKNNPEFRLRRTVSNVVRQALHKCYSTKGGSTFDFLPYTPLELKIHIENQFELWMNWNNHGKYDPIRRTWNIDHIYPQSKLPYDSLDHPNFQKAWDLSNLRPLLAIENIKKSNKIIENISKGCN